MKIIFLDIDGVLNSITSMVTNKNATNPNGLSKEAIGLLRLIVKHTRAKIVISSSWKVFGNKDWFCGLFEAYGWHLPPIIDITPSMSNNRIRGDEIDEWLSYNKCDKYICIDDDSDFHIHQKLVNINGVVGLTLKDALYCIELLGNELPDEQKSLDDLKLHVEFKKPSIV